MILYNFKTIINLFSINSAFESGLASKWNEAEINKRVYHLHHYYRMELYGKFPSKKPQLMPLTIVNALIALKPFVCGIVSSFIVIFLEFMSKPAQRLIA